MAGGTNLMPSLVELNATTGAVVWASTDLKLFYLPSAVASDGQHVWVRQLREHGRGTARSPELNASTDAVDRVIQSSSHGFYLPQDIALDGGMVWLTNPHVNLVSEVNASTGQTVKVISAAKYALRQPYGIAVDGANVWVTNYESGSLTEINASTGALVQVISEPNYGFDEPEAISADGPHIWVADTADNSVTEVDASTGSLVRVYSSAAERLWPGHPDLAIPATFGSGALLDSVTTIPNS